VATGPRTSLLIRALVPRSQCEFQEPFIVDSTRIATELDVHATPLDQALADILASYHATTS